MDSLWQDLRWGVRGLRKNPGFSAVAVLTLALGIGANTAIFSALNAVLLRPLPVKDPGQLVMLSDPEAHGIGVSDGSGPRALYAYSEFEDLRDRNQVFSSICALDSHVRRTEVSLPGSSRAEGETADVTMVSGDYFRVLGITPFLGRTFTSTVDKVEHANPVAVISHGYWKSRFALDPAILNRKIRIRRTTFDIIGVAQAGFAGETVGFSTDIWVPLTMQSEIFPGWTDFLARPADPLNKIIWLQVIARLKPGVTRAQAQSGVNLTARQIRESEAAGLSADRRREYLNSHITLLSGDRGANVLSDSIGDPLKILMAVVGLVLLIACANVATLVLARGAARQREIGVRLALGASRARLLRQLLTESVLLAAIGGALGLVLAQWSDVLLLHMVSTGSNPVLLDLHPDTRVLVFTLGLSLATGVIFGLAPGLRATRPHFHVALQGTGKGVAGSGYAGRMPAGRILVAAQIALSLSVLMVAGLFLHSFAKLARLNPGFDHDHILEFDIGFLESSGYKGPAIHHLHEQMLARLRKIPHAEGATLAFMGLFVGNDTGSQVSIDGSRPSTAAEFRVREDLVPAHHFADIGQPLLMGREFDAADERGKQEVGIINQSLARKFFAGANPLGKRIWYGHDHPQEFTVVGVAADAKHNSLRELAQPEFWLPFFNGAGDEPSFCTFQVRYRGNPAMVAAAIRTAVKEVAAALPPVEIRSMNDLMGESLVAERVISQLAAVFGLVALVLASIGLYGVMAYNVTRRINEIGIRVALGAQPRDILRIVLGEAFTLIAIGVGLGLPSLLAAQHWISSRLFGLTALDPLAIGGAAVLLAIVTILAGYVPARWASRVDPVVALHYDG
ncbi:MAG TPA: ABC transporter permease [Bryobacteraceae bacterium]|nr:ABC transporter permease [Bryobacteraceae bacterium]